jgi:cytochrome P450
VVTRLELITSDFGEIEHFDWVEMLAERLPLAVLAGVLGIPASDQVELHAQLATIGGSLERDDEHSKAAVERSINELESYVCGLMAERGARPGDDLVSGLLQVQVGGDRLTSTEVVKMVTLLLVAGYDTTAAFLGNAALTVLTHPDTAEQWRRNPVLDAIAVEELMRFDPPVQLVSRIVREDTCLGATPLPTRTQVLAVLAAANRDPGVFVDPDRLDLNRDNASRHLGFGAGAHLCLGAQLARIEARVVLPAMLRRWRTWELDGEPIRNERVTLRALTSLPVRLGQPRMTR